MFFFFSSRRRHTTFKCDWSSDVCSSDLICDQAARICLLNGAIHPVEIALYPPPPKPASHGRGNFITDGVTEEGWVPGDGPNLALHDFFNVGRFLSVDQISDELFRRHAHHHAQTLAQRGVQERTRWRRVGNSDGIEAVGGHLTKVRLNPQKILVLSSLIIWTKCPVTYPFHVELFIACK